MKATIPHPRHFDVNMKACFANATEKDFLGSEKTVAQQARRTNGD
jgi:hypothetical protein